MNDQKLSATVVATKIPSREMPIMLGMLMLTSGIVFHKCTLGYLLCGRQRIFLV